MCSNNIQLACDKSATTKIRQPDNQRCHLLIDSFKGYRHIAPNLKRQISLLYSPKVEWLIGYGYKII